MRIEQEPAKLMIGWSIFQVSMAPFVTIFMVYLYISLILSGKNMIAMIIAIPLFILLLAGIWLVSLFGLNYSLPQTIILERDHIRLIESEYFFPWRKKSIKFDVRSIAAYSITDRNFNFLTKYNTSIRYHIPRMNDENLSKFEKIETFLKMHGIKKITREEFNQRILRKVR